MNYIDISGGNKDQKILTEEIIKWCIFARRPIPVLDGVRALFTMPG